MKEAIEQLISQAPDLSSEGKASAVLTTVLEAFDCVTGTIHFLNPDSQMLELVVQQGVPPFLLDKVSLIPIGKGIAGAAAEQRGPVQICNLQTDTSGVAKPDAKKTDVAGSVAVPIMEGEVLKGTLGIGKTEAYDFSEQEINELNQVAHWLARARSV
ncbi:GAF domain-containing protein [Rubritalea spongiae]|uniref:GAF domain-containing protein n=1 Tax=Rubritalea spongiae TaxID=430797 RepID=A0ABW5E4B8_9BACT